MTRDQNNVSSQRLRITEIVAPSDAMAVGVRPIRPDDAGGLQAFHPDLSLDSLYLRWLSAHPVLTAEEAEALSNVDCAGRMAFVAMLPAEAGEAIIGVALYSVITGAQSDEAEAAVVVADAYQQPGLGPLLLQRLLAYARPKASALGWLRSTPKTPARCASYGAAGCRSPGASTTVPGRCGSISPRADESETVVNPGSENCGDIAAGLMLESGGPASSSRAGPP